MSALSPGKTVGQYVLEQPALSKVFEKYGIDFCCGGKRPLDEVCREKGIDVSEIIRALNEAVTVAETEKVNWKEASISEMVGHIYNVHHVYLYNEMPRLSRMVQKVARVHGENDSRLVQLEHVYEQLVSELTIHMMKEENVLFPYCRDLENARVQPRFHCGDIGNPIRVMEMEHEQAGTLLENMRALTDNYTPSEWACNTYRAMLDGLKEMESDIHQHIHEENNILFPKALKKSDSLSQPDGE
jgi:regulator of cell morphogenesis and NO signaling